MSITIFCCKLSPQNNRFGVKHEYDLDIIQSGALHEREEERGVKGTTNGGTQILIRGVLAILYGTVAHLTQGGGTVSSGHTVLKCQ